MPLTGMEFVIAGRLPGMTHQELAMQLKSNGAVVYSRLRASTTHLLVGARPGKALQNAQSRGIQVLQFTSLPDLIAQPTQRPCEALSVEERLAELRGLLDRSQSKRTWRMICLYFDLWPEDELEVGIAYAAQHLKSWNPELCTSPKHWLHRAREGWANPRMALVRDLQISTKILTFPPYDENGTTQELDPTLGDRGLVTLLESGYIDQVEHLSLPAQDIGDAGLEALSTHQGLAQLRSLQLEGNVYNKKGVLALCDAAWISQLESLRLQSPGLTRSEVSELRQVPALQQIPNLELLHSLRNTRWSGHDSDDDSFQYTFMPDGHVYREDDGRIIDDPKDQWRQLGDQVVISMTYGYSTHRGTLQDTTATGSASNVVDHHWTWTWEYMD